MLADVRRRFEPFTAGEMRTRLIAFFVFGVALTVLVWEIDAKQGLGLFSQYSSQTLFAPLLAGYLLVNERRGIFAAPRYSVVRALQLTAVAVMLGLLGLYFGLHSQPYLFSSLLLLGAIVLFVAAFVACFGETAALRAIFPLSMLVMMIPLPDSFVDAIITLLRVQSTRLTEIMLSACGIPVYRDGFLLTLPGVTIEVAKECSGINSSVALAITMILIARQSLHANWRRCLLVLASIPLSVIKNALRITILTVLALRVDPSFLTGKLHHQGGFFFYLLAMSLMYPVWKIIKHGDQPSASQDKGFVLSGQTLASQDSPIQLRR